MMRSRYWHCSPGLVAIVFVMTSANLRAESAGQPSAEPADAQRAVSAAFGSETLDRLLVMAAQTNQRGQDSLICGSRVVSLF